MKSEIDYFNELTKIPRPSGYKDSILEYLKTYALKHDFVIKEDEEGNIVIRKGVPKVTLQAHVDMVPVSDHPFDFTREAIETYVEDGWMKAKGTTLGGDDGAGVALMLSLLERVPNLECLFTTDEETNMTGAAGLAEDFLIGHYLINLDHEHVDSILIGCAGGMNTDIFFTPEFEPVSGNWHTLKISNLLSGHSGLEIDLGRANAIIIAAEFLKSKGNFRISSFKGGSKPNVIPKEAEVIFSADNVEIDKFIEKVHKEYPVEKDAIITVTKTNPPKIAWTSNFSQLFVNAILSAPNGVFERNEEGVVTSSNLAIVTEENHKIMIATLQRSALCVADSVNAVSESFNNTGASIISYGNYPGWLLPKDAPLLKIAKKTYSEVFGHDPRIETTHGGVECGMIQEKYPKMEIISVGPTVENVHTIDERLNIDSLRKIGLYLETLISKLT